MSSISNTDPGMISQNLFLERTSSAVTLSDMEIFIFPELMYSLLLANILSPVIWRWRENPWFADIRKCKPYKRMQKLRQYIMDNYVFNLDLDTWGLTRQDRELARFSSILSPDVIAQSNALFGYQGDSYYFDLDIRTHFGLDKYGSDVIPYWKTETVEAMDAFRFKDGFATGAGECVSLAALYGAALFIVAGIPLEDIFLMATPLHSQNFVDVGDGVLINNRRLVTKSMWMNGTQISAQARRALENERVTIVSHPTGWIHTLYPEMTMAPDVFHRFSSKLTSYLQASLTPDLFGNFLRYNQQAQHCFVYRSVRTSGAVAYLPLERAYAQESRCPYLFSGTTRDKLLGTLSDSDFLSEIPQDRLLLNDVEKWILANRVNWKENLEDLVSVLDSAHASGREMVSALRHFCYTIPKLPDVTKKDFIPLEKPLQIHDGMSRQEILEHLESIRDGNIMADLAFYSWRDLSRTSYPSFVKASLERNPVSVVGSQSLSLQDLITLLKTWPNESIYEEPFRLSQPDEVWNYRRGDGWEKALVVADVLCARGKLSAASLSVVDGDAVLSNSGSEVCRFPMKKRFAEMNWKLC